LGEHRFQKILTDQLGLRKAFEYLGAEGAITRPNIKHTNSRVGLSGDETHYAPQDNAALIIARGCRGNPILDVLRRMPIVPTVWIRWGAALLKRRDPIF
jgi:hypothetical protein